METQLIIIIYSRNLAVFVANSAKFNLKMNYSVVKHELDCRVFVMVYKYTLSSIPKSFIFELLISKKKYFNNSVIY